jgi:hypothetical protein
MHFSLLLDRITARQMEGPHVTSIVSPNAGRSALRP